MRRISLQTIQKILILSICIWLIILFNNVANLPVLQRTITDSLSRKHLKFHQQQDYSSSSTSRRRSRQEITRQRIYGNDKRTNSYSSYSKSNTNNINVNVNRTVERNNTYDSNNKYDDANRKNSNMNTNNKHIFLDQTTTYVDDEEEYEDHNDDEDDEDYDDDKKTSRSNNKRDRDRNRRPKNKKHHFNNDNDDADYDDDFNNDYEESSSLRRSRLPPRRWRRNKKKKKRRNVDILLPKPIIVMGFPKAGTSSIFSFFQRQGLNSQHWYCCQPQTSAKKGGPLLMSDCLMKNLRQNRTKSILKGCGNFDIYSEINGPRKTKFHPKARGKIGYILDDGTVEYNGPPGKRIFFPQHFRIEEIHESYPNATWILNWRDYDSWIESVIKWGTNDRLHYQFLNEYYMQGVIPYIPSKGNITDVKAVMKKIYYDHHDMVRKFVQRHPSHVLVEVNITDKNTSLVLAEAFGLDPIAWTNVNSSKKSSFGTLRRVKRILAGYGDFIGSYTWWIFVLITILYLGWTLGFEWT